MLLDEQRNKAQGLILFVMQRKVRSCKRCENALLRTWLRTAYLCYFNIT